jgi:hypothetical protein
VIVPYDVVDPGTRAAMERFAAIGTLGLSGQQQYAEIFNTLLVAYELGHCIKEIPRRPLTRWQAEYGANRMMVAFWRDHPANASTDAPACELRRAADADSRSCLKRHRARRSDYFNASITSLEADPAPYSLFQRKMVRLAML